MTTQRILAAAEILAVGGLALSLGALAGWLIGRLGGEG
jgi:hypothetical protein